MLTRMVSIFWPCDPPTSASQSAGITGLSHHARPHFYTLTPVIWKINQESNPIYNSYQNKKHQVFHLTTEVKDLYKANYVILMWDVKEDIKIKRYSRIIDLKTNIVEISVLTKAICRANAILIKIPMTFLTETEKKNPKIFMQWQKTQNRQRTPEQKQQKLEASRYQTILPNILQSCSKLKQYGTGIKVDTQTTGIE